MGAGHGQVVLRMSVRAFLLATTAAVPKVRGFRMFWTLN